MTQGRYLHLSIVNNSTAIINLALKKDGIKKCELADLPAHKCFPSIIGRQRDQYDFNQIIRSQNEASRFVNSSCNGVSEKYQDKCKKVAQAYVNYEIWQYLDKSLGQSFEVYLDSPKGHFESWAHPYLNPPASGIYEFSGGYNRSRIVLSPKDYVEVFKRTFLEENFPVLEQLDQETQDLIKKYNIKVEIWRIFWTIPESKLKEKGVPGHEISFAINIEDIYSLGLDNFINFMKGKVFPVIEELELKKTTEESGSNVSFD